MGVELLFNSVEFGSQGSCQQTPRELETRCGKEGHTRPRGHSENPRCSCQQTSRHIETRCGRESHTGPRGPSESPDGVDPNIRRTRTTQRDGHNSGVKIWSLCSVSASSHMLTFQTLAMKWEVNIFLKKSSCVLSSCVCRLSCVCYHCVGMYPVYICMQQVGCFV